MFVIKYTIAYYTIKYTTAILKIQIIILIVCRYSVIKKWLHICVPLYSIKCYDSYMCNDRNECNSTLAVMIINNVVIGVNVQKKIDPSRAGHILLES